eukprot:1191330-Prorocentrum_minimum.AAC.1
MTLLGVYCYHVVTCQKSDPRRRHHSRRPPRPPPQHPRRFRSPHRRTLLAATVPTVFSFRHVSLPGAQARASLRPCHLSQYNNRQEPPTDHVQSDHSHRTASCPSGQHLPPPAGLAKPTGPAKPAKRLPALRARPEPLAALKQEAYTLAIVYLFIHLTSDLPRHPHIRRKSRPSRKRGSPDRAAEGSLARCTRQRASGTLPTKKAAQAHGARGTKTLRPERAS